MPRKAKSLLRKEGKLDLNKSSSEIARLLNMSYQERMTELYEKQIKGKVKIEHRTKKYSRFVHKNKAKRLLEGGKIYLCQDSNTLYEK